MADTFISSGVSSDGIVLTGEKLYVENGGEAVNTTVNEGGRMYVSSGGTANNTTLNASGRVNVSSGGTATVTTVNSGGVVSLAGGSASGITVNASGIVYVSSGGKAAATEFQSGGSMYVYAKGEVNTAIVNSGGFLEVSSGGTASGVEVLEGGGFRFAVAPGTCVQGTHTGSAFEMKDGRISGYTVTSGGWLHVLKGGVADNATVQSNGVVWVSSGGRLAGATLCESGRVTVSSGGIAENTLVSSGGRIQVSSGGILTGSMSIANGGSVSAYEGAILDFDLTRVSAEAPALVNDLSLVKGAPGCTLTVSASQASGTYKLAEGAAEFSGTITIQNTYGDSFGTFTVGQTVYAGDSRFTLNLTDETLSVTVVADAGPDDAPTNPTGTAEKVSWDATGTGPYVVEYSTDGFEHVVSVVTAGTAIDTPELPAGTYQWRVKTESGSDWAVGNAIVSEAGSDAPKAVRSNADGNEDLFFATPDGTWGYLYYARHTGSINDWTGTNEMVSANGRGRIRNLFFGSADPNVLCLTDGVNGDALFVDDVYTDLPEEIEAQTARLYKIREIRAGAGDDIVDMTSQQFEYVGEGLTIRGGDGDDVIWANRGARNSLFGDAGNDRIVGASGDDVIAGGIGDDRLHGGGGNDTFTFCENWGTDTVEQLETGTVTLWFLSGSMENWDAETLTYSDGENSVTVSGVTADRITLKFGDDGFGQFAGLSAMGAFADFSSKRVFGESANGILASV